MLETLYGIAELPTYISLADKLLSADERQDLINYLAEHPKAGDIIEGTGGVRKLRWRRGGQGKSGGVRVIYFSTMISCRCTCSRSLPKVTRPT
jgi:hypothetical protein